jgi:hypothetical protein
MAAGVVFFHQAIAAAGTGNAAYTRNDAAWRMGGEPIDWSGMDE